jgi:hypothetical protein
VFLYPKVSFASGCLGVLLIFRKLSAMVRFDIVNAANVAFAVDPVEQPGATLDILAALRVKPGSVQEIAWPKHKGFYPG